MALPLLIFRVTCDSKGHPNLSLRGHSVRRFLDSTSVTAQKFQGPLISVAAKELTPLIQKLPNIFNSFKWFFLTQLMQFQVKENESPTVLKSYLPYCCPPSWQPTHSRRNVQEPSTPWYQGCSSRKDKLRNYFIILV